MRIKIFFCFVCLAALALLSSLPSCSKTDHTPPGILFNPTPPYVYDDTTLPQGTIFSVYLTVLAAGVNQLLDTAYFSKSVNGGPDSVFQTMQLSTTFFNQYYSYEAGKPGNIEKYVFTFGQTNGLIESDSLIIKDTIGTVQ